MCLYVCWCWWVCWSGGWCVGVLVGLQLSSRVGHLVHAPYFFNEDRSRATVSLGLEKRSPKSKIQLPLSLLMTGMAPQHLRWQRPVWTLSAWPGLWKRDAACEYRAVRHVML